MNLQVSTFFRALVFLVGVCSLSWVGVLWWWQRGGHAIEVQDVVIYLGMLPLAFALLLLALRWAWSSAAARQTALAVMPAGAGAGMPPASETPQKSADAQAHHRTVRLVHASLLCAVGEHASQLLEAAADGKPLPQPDADLRSDTELPVLCARIDSALLPTDATRMELNALLQGLREAQPEWLQRTPAGDVVRALSALRPPLLTQFEWLQSLPSSPAPGPASLHQDTSQGQGKAQQPGMRLLLGWPAHWSAFDQALAQAWVEALWKRPDIGMPARYALTLTSLAGTAEDLWLKADQPNQPGHDQGWLMVAACHSDVDPVRVHALATAQRLHDATERPSGCVPGEAGVALLLAPTDWVAPPELDPPPVQLHRPALLRRNKAIEERGRIEHQELGEAITHALAAAQTEAANAALLVCDADLHSPRAAELYGTTLGQLPQLDPIHDLRVLGTVTGHTGVASLLLVIAASCEWVRSTRKTALALGMADSHQRMALVLKPQERANEASAGSPH